MVSPAVNPPVVTVWNWAPKKNTVWSSTVKGVEISSTQTNGVVKRWPVVIFVTLEVFGLGRSEKNSCYQTSIKKMHPGGRIPSLITVHSLKVTAKQFAPETLAGDQKERIVFQRVRVLSKRLGSKDRNCLGDVSVILSRGMGSCVTWMNGSKKNRRHEENVLKLRLM